MIEAYNPQDVCLKHNLASLTVRRLGHLNDTNS